MHIVMKVKYKKTCDDSLGWLETSVTEIIECGKMEFTKDKIKLSVALNRNVLRMQLKCQTFYEQIC